MSQVLILDNIRSVFNVGSIFRTAETVGIKTIYCVGTTPTPLDRFGRARKDFAKVSLGAEQSLSWKWVSDEESLVVVSELKKEGVFILAVEQSEKSEYYKDIKPGQNCAVIMGNEVSGVRPSLLELADAVAEIPMKGNKESLNVSVTTGIVLFEWFG